MKKVICMQCDALTEDELEAVNGGFNWDHARHEATNHGCGGAAKDFHRANKETGTSNGSGRDYRHGCNSGARR